MKGPAERHGIQGVARSVCVWCVCAVCLCVHAVCVCDRRTEGRCSRPTPEPPTCAQRHAVTTVPMAVVVLEIQLTAVVMHRHVQQMEETTQPLQIEALWLPRLQKQRIWQGECVKWRKDSMEGGETLKPFSSCFIGAGTEKRPCAELYTRCRCGSVAPFGEGLSVPYGVG